MQGIQQADSTVTLKLFNAAKEDKNDIIAEIYKSKAVLVGSSTINNGMLHSIGGLLEMIRGLKFKNKKAAAFGSYGWSGEAVKLIGERLAAAGFSLADEGIRTLWVPDTAAEEACVHYGKQFAEALNE